MGYSFVICDEHGKMIAKCLQKGFEFARNSNKGLWKVVIDATEKAFSDIQTAIAYISKVFCKKFGIDTENLLLCFKKPGIIEETEESKVTAKSDDKKVQKRLEYFNEPKRVQRRVKRNEEARLKSQTRWEQVAQSKGVDLQTYRKLAEKKLKEVFDRSSLYVRVRAVHSLLVLKDERIKTQFETGTSQGANNKGMRSNREKEMFGYLASLVPGVDQSFRPIYGFISDDGHLDQGSSRGTAQYGSIIFKLKDSLKSRTTWSTRDSLGRDPKTEPDFGASLVSRPTLEGIWNYEIKDISNIDSADSLAGRSYVEVQVHGQVTLDDVEEVIIDQTAAMKMEIGSGYYTSKLEYDTCLVDLKNELNKRGIAFRIFQ